jgi:hypothetical protein
LDVTYGLGAKDSQGRDGRSEPRGDVYEIFKARLNKALADLVESRGENYAEAEKAYNEDWPDGLSVRITRKPCGGFRAEFSSGEILEFKDYDDLGAAMMIMRDRELFYGLNRENECASPPGEKK